MSRIILLLAILCSNLSVAVADDSEFLFIAELQRLRLFDLAEKRVSRQLARSDLDPVDQTDFLIEQMRIIAARAQSSGGAQREPLWNRAREVAADFATAQPAHPRLLLIRLQDALTVQTRGEQERVIASVTDHPQQMSQAALVLRDAERLLDDLAEDLEKLLPRRRAQPVSAPELTAAELERLQGQIGLQRARTRWQRALCFEKGARDRKALLLESREIAETTANRLDPLDELSARLRIEQMHALRELSSYEEATRLWPQLESEKLPMTVRQAGLAEYLRSLAAVNLDQAAAAWEDEKFRPLLVSPPPELQLARLELLVRRAQGAGSRQDNAAAQRWQDQATLLAQELESRFGIAWGRAADELLTSLAGKGADTGTASADLLARQADIQYVKRRPREAQALYDRAAEAARSGKDPERAFTLQYKAALIAQELKSPAEAATRMEKLALEFKSHASSAAVHLAACWNKAQQVRGEAAAGDAYATLLREHTARWPGSSTADQASLWLGQWLEAKREWLPAFEAYCQVRRESEHFAAALAGAARTSQAELARLAEAGQPTEIPARQLLHYFESGLAQKKDQQQWLEPDRIAALHAVRILVTYASDGSGSAERLARQALAAAADAPESWRMEMEALLIAALAGQKSKIEEARQQLQSARLREDQLLLLLEQLGRTGEKLPADQRRTLAQLELQVIGRLLDGAARDDPALRKQLRRLQAAAWAQTGERTKALTTYEQLVSEDPHNGSLQEAYATLLAQGTDHASLEKALARWRIIASRSRAREQRWYQAKFAVVELQMRLGQKNEARTLARYLLETPPGIPEETWKKRFAALLEEP